MSPGGNEPGLAPCRDGSPWSRGRHRGPKLQRNSKVELQVVLSFLPTCPLLHHPHYRTVTLVTGMEERWEGGDSLDEVQSEPQASACGPMGVSSSTNDGAYCPWAKAHGSVWFDPPGGKNRSSDFLPRNGQYPLPQQPVPDIPRALLDESSP